MRRTALVAVAAAMALAGCGGDDDEPGAGDSLATLAPADTFFYLEATVRPDDDLAEAIETIAARFPGGEDIGATIVEELDESAAESGQTYAEDLEPWLGERAAMLVDDPSRFDEDATPPFVVEATDPDAAFESFAEASDDPVEEGSHEGVDYATGDEMSAAAVGEFLLVAPTVEELEEMIEVANGDGDSLADADGFSYDVGEIDGADAAGYLWVNQEPLIDLIAADAELTPEQTTDLMEGFGYRLGQPVLAALTAEPDAAELTMSLPIDAERVPSGGGELFGELPADADLAGLCAACLEPVFAGFELGLQQAASADGVDTEEAREFFERTFGVSVDTLQDVFGDVGYFLRADGPLGIEGATVAEIADPDAAGEALVAVRGVLSATAREEGFRISDPRGAPPGAEGFTLLAPDLPLPVTAILLEDRLAVGVGVGVAEEALAPAETLADSGRLGEIEDALGGEATPTAVVDFDALVAGAERVLGAAPGFAEALPYLEPIAQIVAGSELNSDGQLTTVRVSFD